MTSSEDRKMAYSIVENTATAFIENRNIQLPRFQRKQSWGPEDNFKLCISVFKGYPIGVVIVNSIQQPKPIDWLLDGRQRRIALTEMRNNPVSVYQWAQKFVKFKNSDDEQVLKNSFFSSIDNFLQNDFQNENKTKDDDDYYDEEAEEQASFDFNQQYSSLEGLCDLITIVHPFKLKKSRLERMFLFNNIIPVQDLEYTYPNNGNYETDISRLWSTIRSIVYNGEDSKEEFISYIIKRYKLDANSCNKIKKYIEQNWEYYDKCFKTLNKCEQTLQTSTIGIIKLTNATPLDAQNIFSLVNDGGTKLTAEELLSARPFWNIVVNNPSATLKDDVNKLYQKLNIKVPDEVYRWDLCASFLLRIDKNNLIFDDYSANLNSENDTALKQILSLGFKTISAIYVGGVNNISVTKLERKKEIDWNIDIDNLVSEINIVINILEDYDYFKYIKSWNQTIMSLTSNTVAIEFLSIIYTIWKQEGQPPKSPSTVKKIGKIAFILFDRLVYEYSNRIWAGSSDNRLATDLKIISDRIKAVEKKQWIELISELSNGEFKGKTTKSTLIKPFIYHYYCMKKFMPTMLNVSTKYEIDHIVAQSLFNGVNENDIIKMKDNILNFALLPKGDNIIKSDQKLSVIMSSDHWLSDQIKKYAEINDEDMNMLSDLTNVKRLNDIRLPLYNKAFDSVRDYWINN